MLPAITPFNIELLLLRAPDVVQLQRVKVLDIMSGMTKNFHPEGLFSVEIFSKVGDARRNKTFGYVDLRVGVFHPAYFKALCDLKELYGEIMSGKAYAVFDLKLRDFVKSDSTRGQTGYSYFIEHLPQIKFEERPSPKRIDNIKFVRKYIDNPFFDKLLVMPAGLRDYVVDENGKPSEDEINNLYRRVIGGAGIFEGVAVSGNEEYLDAMRYNLQTSVNAIYDYVMDLMSGKSGLLQSKFSRRNIENTTRNVIVPYVQTVVDRASPQFVRSDQSVVGLYQFLRTILPKAVQLTRDGFLTSVFPGPNTAATVTNPQTLQSEQVNLHSEWYDEWMTYEGLEKQAARLKIKDLRHEPIVMDGYYLGLVAQTPKKGVRLIHGLEELPEGLTKKNVRPITPVDLFYMAVAEHSKTVPATVTRYPITGYGSIHPCWIYLKTTINGQILNDLDENWQPTGIVYPEFPSFQDLFYDGLAVPPVALARLGADYDGDTCSLICYNAVESREEFKALMHDKKYYVAVDGSMAFSASNDVIDLVLANIS